MKRIAAFIGVVLLCLAAVSAQNTDQKEGYTRHVVKWYEDLTSISAKYGVPENVIMTINGLKNKKLSIRQELFIPNTEDLWHKDMPGVDSVQTAAPDTTAFIPEALFPASTETDVTGSIHLAVVLPLSGGNEVQNGNCLDFYSGVLMAAETIGKEGIDVDIDVHDFSKGVSGASLSEEDIILGPIRSEDIAEVVSMSGDKIIVSPLDQRTEALAKSNSSIMVAPAGSAAQYAEAVAWAREEAAASGKNSNFILVTCSADLVSDEEARAALAQEGLNFQVCTCGVQGDIEGWDKAYREAAWNSVIIAINNEAILNNAVRNMSIEVAKGNVSTFTSSKIHSYASIPLENIHRARVHALCTYFVDYRDAAVKKFVGRYKALFKCEPTQFAFQGYDLGCYLMRSYSKYGKDWKNRIDSEPVFRGLQTNIKASRIENGGLVNIGIRRVIFEQNYQLILSEASSSISGGSTDNWQAAL